MKYEITATVVLKASTDDMSYPPGATLEQVQKFEEENFKDAIEASVLHDSMNITVAVRELQA